MAKYVGKRIVPKHRGVWNRTKAYEMLCIVYDQASGDSYISRKEVPAGTLLTNSDYWALCSDFSEQMYMLDQRIVASEAAIKADNDATEAAAATDKDADFAAEVVDARVGWDSQTYGSLGDAIRGQLEQGLKYAGYLSRTTSTEDLDDLASNTIYLVSSDAGETTLGHFPDYLSHGVLITTGQKDNFKYQSLAQSIAVSAPCSPIIPPNQAWYYNSLLWNTTQWSLKIFGYNVQNIADFHMPDCIKCP